MSVPSLTSLLKQATITDHDAVLASANSALKTSKSDLAAQHAKVVALLKLDRFGDALHAFETGGQSLQNQARLEYAYTLYKSGRPAEAAEIARQGAERGHRHVEAQARYRIEDFRRAAELYAELAARIEDDAEADLRINSAAVDAQLEWSDQGDAVKKKKPGREDLEAFETAYNAACGSIARGELGQGEVLLKRAKGLCEGLEDMSEEEKRAELAPITVQQVYVLTRQGRHEEAIELAKTVHAELLTDKSSSHIAQVNAIAASGGKPANPFLAQRVLGNDIESLKPDQPFNFQANTLAQNRYALDLLSMKFGGVADSTAELIAKAGGTTVDAKTNNLSAFNAAAHAKCATGKEALKHILPLLEKRPNDVGLILTIAQLYVLTNNFASALTLLEAFLSRLEESNKADVRYAPGLVGTIVSLYAHVGRRGPMRSELAKAASYWHLKPKEQRPSGVTHLLKAAGASLLELEDSEQEKLASEIFTSLHEADPEDRYAAAGLLAASPSRATPESTATLQPIDRLVSGIDVDSLESAGIAQPPLPEHGAAVTTRKRPAEDNKSKKAKKIRKSRLPKDYDPNKQPDPERWLPLRDRSTYRPKGKKGKARQAMFSQGAVESEGSRPGTPGGEVVKGKQAQGGGGNKKKKGKR